MQASDVDVTPGEVRARLGAVQLIDVRRAEEWEAGRIADARHVEMQHLGAEAASVDRERPVIFYCHVGSRSRMAADAFRQAGYEAYSMAGGLSEWVRQGLPLDPPDGYVWGD